MNNKLVERVARAICQADEQNGAAPWDWYGSDKARSGYFDQARAALQAAGVDELVVALRYYADDHKYPNDGPWGCDSDDWGKVASAALARHKGE